MVDQNKLLHPILPNAIEIVDGVFVTPETQVRVERVLIFEGTAAAVKEAVQRRWLGKGRPEQRVIGMHAYEKSFVVSIDEVQDPTYYSAEQYPDGTKGRIVLKQYREMVDALRLIANAASATSGAVIDPAQIARKVLGTTKEL